jgi:preprotein translocase subunit YajC
MQLDIQSILLQAAPAAGPFGNFGGIAIMVLMFVVMYFFMIRPQAKRAKEQKKFAESMNVGEQIVTTAGIHGRINKANDDGTLQLEISRNTFMTVERSAVSMEMTAAYRKKIDAAGSVTVVPSK